jgi:hypothetical protein
MAVLVGLTLLGSAATVARCQSTPYTIYVGAYRGYVYDPYGGYLHGAADVIRAQGQFLTDQQRAYQMREQYRQSKIETRRKQQQQWLWERDNLPTIDDMRVRTQQEQVFRARHGSPITEVWSAKALNDLLEDILKTRSANTPVAPWPLSDEILAKINVTSGKSGGNIGLIKDGRVTWPLLLRRKTFAPQREQIDQLVVKVVKQSIQGQADADALEELDGLVKGLQDELSTTARAAGDKANWSATMYVRAKRFLNDFDDALRVLQEPDAGSFLSGKFAAKGKSVMELAEYMDKNGLLFAPATAGNETAYMSLYRTLRAYDEAHGSHIRAAR